MPIGDVNRPRVCGHQVSHDPDRKSRSAQNDITDRVSRQPKTRVAGMIQGFSAKRAPSSSSVSLNLHGATPRLASGKAVKRRHPPCWSLGASLDCSDAARTATNDPFGQSIPPAFRSIQRRWLSTWPRGASNFATNCSPAYRSRARETRRLRSGRPRRGSR
jgi:hypothetical protein